MLAVRALNQRQLYPLKLFWERHKVENRLNDPEVTTDNLSSGQPSSGSVRSRVSSILSGKRPVINSPMASRRLSQHSRSLDSLARGVLLSTVQTHTLPSASTVPQLSGTLPVSLRDPYVISTSVSSIHPILKGKKVFQSPRFLPQRFTTLQQQRSFSRLLSLRCCVSLFCWLPLYVTVVLHLFSVHYPRELPEFIHWLIFIQSSISSLLPLCDASYRRALWWAAHSVFNTCARQHTDNRKTTSTFASRVIWNVRSKELRMFN